MSRRRVEVFMVLVIVAAVAGPGAVGVVRVRAVAARTTCAGHLGQTAMAARAYADANGGVLPTGTIPNAELAPEQRLSWWVSILPFVEQGEVFQQFDLSRGPDDPRNEKAAGNRWRHLVCPASGEYDRDTRQWRSETPVTNYVGVAGVGVGAAGLPAGHPHAGAFGYDRRTSLKGGFPDGTAHTLLLIETGREPGHWAHGGHATVRAFEWDVPYIGPERPFGGFHNGPMVLFGSRDRVCVTAFADGSYHPLTDKIDPAVLEALATVGGREALPSDW
ncbi:MAG: DUF1559 domain-containing protein [Planctomycetes bacterium]|nr:DUF1559 domain-containing protein [Planctomycetota bacterium]